MSYLRELYEEVILDHNRNPRNFNTVPENESSNAHGFNPLCGDEFTVHMAVKDNVITGVTFEGCGCAISTASASMMTEAIKGKTVAEATVLFDSMRELLTGDDDSATAQKEKVGKLKVLSGVREYPMRVKCATLAWHVMQAALTDQSNTICTE